MDRDRYDQLIESIYNAALDSDCWNQTIIGIRDAFHSMGAGFLFQSKHEGYIGGVFEGIDPAYLDLYGQYFDDINPWFVIPGLMRQGNVVTDLTLEKIYKDRKFFFNTEYCQGWFLPQDFRHSMGVNLINDDAYLLSFTFLRSEISGHYSEQEIANFRSIGRHLVKAVEINTRTNNLLTKTKTIDTALGKLKLGVVALNSRKQIVYRNSYARMILDKADGLCEKKACLTALDDKSQNQLKQSVQQAFRHSKSSTISVFRSKRCPLSLCILPSNENRLLWERLKPMVTVLITDPDDRDVGQVDYLTKRWNLTLVEANFAIHLLQGKSISEIAEIMSMTTNTARWYSKQLIQKLGVKRQPELVLKLVNDLSVSIVKK